MRKRSDKMITVLAGGTGSVEIVRGLDAQSSDVHVISNVGDNYWFYGLYFAQILTS